KTATASYPNGIDVNITRDSRGNVTLVTENGRQTYAARGIDALGRAAEEDDEYRVTTYRTFNDASRTYTTRVGNIETTQSYNSAFQLLSSQLSVQGGTVKQVTHGIDSATGDLANSRTVYSPPGSSHDGSQGLPNAQIDGNFSLSYSGNG